MAVELKAAVIVSSQTNPIKIAFSFTRLSVDGFLTVRDSVPARLWGDDRCAFARGRFLAANTGGNMRKLTMLAAAALAATALSATSAMAQPVYSDCGAGTCFRGQTDNINIDSGSSGHIGSTLFSFSSITDTLVAQGSSQATLGAADGLINNATFTIQPGYYFNLAEVNLQQAFSNTTQVTLTSSGGGSQNSRSTATGRTASVSTTGRLASWFR